MSKTKIEWCDEVWNPAWGCLNNCPYCYARKYAKRFYMKVAEKEVNYCLNYGKTTWHGLLPGYTVNEQLRAFKPFWLESNFMRKFPKKSARVFVNSMSDIKFWKPEWVGRVLNRIRENPQHTFIFLTQGNDIYADYNFPDNCWLGYTTPTDYDFYDKSMYAYCDYPNMFFSIEPILNKFGEMGFLAEWVKWVIIGAETAGRKERVMPKLEWIQEIVDNCRAEHIPVFLKGSLKNIWPGKLIQEWPK